MGKPTMKSSALAALVLAAGLLIAPATSGAYTVTPLEEGRIAVELQAAGTDRAAAITAARQEAVRGAAGRVLLGENLVLAEELLTKYLANYGDRFVTAVEVLDQRFEAGELRLNARVFIDYDALARDLDEKMFLYKPAYRPQFAAFMNERLDGESAGQGTAREALTQALRALGMRPYANELPSPPSSTDVTADDLLFEAAMVSAQRAGVEVVVSGEVSTTLRERRELYYDEFWFYDTEMTARMVRVDTGEVLFEAKAFGSASDKNPSNAIRLAIERAAEQVSAELVGEFEQFWPRVVQARSDYQVLFTGVDDEKVRIIMQNIERLGQGVKVSVRKGYDRTAVLAIDFPGSREQLIENLLSCPYPTLSVTNPEAERLFEVQVSG
jgi:hypothetical protein